MSSKFSGERIVFPTNGAGTTGHPHTRVELDPLTQYYKIKMD